MRRQTEEEKKAHEALHIKNKVLMCSANELIVLQAALLTFEPES